MPETPALVLAGFGAGLINGAAGGGTLVSFPALLALGYPATVANVTSTVGIWTGYLGGAAGFRAELVSQRRRLVALGPAGLAGGVLGAVLLVLTPNAVFRELAPLLILGACALFAIQPWLSTKVRSGAHPEPADDRDQPMGALVGTFLAAIYGGYFGAGLGVILLAVLGFAIDDELVRINGLRSVLALLVNSVAVVVFAVGADVAWGAAGVLAVASLLGGYVGASVARRLPAPLLRAVIIAIGTVAALRLLIGLGRTFSPRGFGRAVRGAPGGGPPPGSGLGRS